MAANEPTSGHYRTLFLAFVLSKAVLVAIAAGSQVGPTYDTSTSLLSLSLNTNASSSAIRNAVAGARPDDHLLTRLTSWDAVYFLKAAERGYLFEQEWAFGSALPMCISLLHRALTPLGITNPSLVDPAHVLPLLGVAITNTCHFLSSLVLYQLGVRVCADATWALVAALLHLFSPAGMFLVAPFQESPFALLSFLGWWLLVKSCYCSSAKSHSSSSSSTSYSLSQDVLTLLAGVSFGLATLFRSNGLLNGIPLALDFLRTLYNLVEDVGPTPGGSGSAVAASTTAAHARRLVVLGLSGMTAAAGSLVPQVLAYRMYCTGAGAAGSTNVRPWCVKLVPSIYNFVQQHYW
ncbi:GPI mannosyltransferase 2 [Coniella lustricola]|uniref:GPI mannosyltransferase 2 n=1 Tax=Coniella lustricola TaxID=2025994 RepID=A0A2T3A7M3_9PEZI|nr:GPI mannosyltransferase 2 [Coniella lustricola]